MKTYTIGKATALGCDTDGGKWVIICHIHGLIFNARTLNDAKAEARTLCVAQCSAFN
jgi:hypothetical protein